jgi:hypothetical protein
MTGTEGGEGEEDEEEGDDEGEISVTILCPPVDELIFLFLSTRGEVGIGLDGASENAEGTECEILLFSGLEEENTMEGDEALRFSFDFCCCCSRFCCCFLAAASRYMLRTSGLMLASCCAADFGVIVFLAEADIEGLFVSKEGYRSCKRSMTMTMTHNGREHRQHTTIIFFRFC